MSYNQSHLSRRSRRPWIGRASFIVLAWCLSWVVVWSATAQDTCYRIVDLGALGFTPVITEGIFGINNANQAVFTAVVNGKKHAMLYLPADAFDLTAGVHDLHTLANLDAGVESAAHDINDAGIVVGQANNRAHVWRLDKDPFDFIDLGTFSAGGSSTAFAINNDTPFPIVVGDGNLLFNCQCDPDEPFDELIRRGFALPLEDPPDLLDDAALLKQSAGLGCQPNTFARDVKSLAALTVAGYSTFTGEACHAPEGCGAANAATAWIDPNPGNNVGAALTPLPPDGPFFSGGTQAWGVSDTEAIVGYGHTHSSSPCPRHAVYWPTFTDPPVDLGEATGVDQSAQTLALRINNNQLPQTVQAVGWSSGTPSRALLWECDGNCDQLPNWSATDLNDTIQHCSNNWSIREAYDVNDNGWIIGMGIFAAQKHAILLTPLANCCDTDLNGDGTVGAADLLALLVAWGPCPPLPADCLADLDCDGSVGAADLLILLIDWGAECNNGVLVGGGPVPRNVQDCIDRFCCDEEDLPAFENCICLVDPECDITP